MNQYNDVVVTGKIDYSAFVYTGHYKLELPSGSIIDDTVLNSSFNVSDTSFVYTSKSILGNQPSWVFYKSFTRVGSCTKTVKVSCVATTKGTKSGAAS